MYGTSRIREDILRLPGVAREAQNETNTYKPTRFHQFHHIMVSSRLHDLNKCPVLLVPAGPGLIVPHSYCYNGFINEEGAYNHRISMVLLWVGSF